MKATGRPIAYLVLFIGSWIALRVATLNFPGHEVNPGAVSLASAPASSPQRKIRSSAPKRLAQPVDATAENVARLNHQTDRPFAGARTENRFRSNRSTPALIAASMVATPDHIADPFGKSETPSQNPIALDVEKTADQFALPSPSPAQGWRLSAWAIMRAGNAKENLSSFGTLGGSQAGARAVRPIKNIARDLSLSISARASMPLALRNGKEGAIGLSLNHQGRLAKELAVERRIAFDRGGKDATAIFAAGGITHLPVVKSVSLDSYAQAGIVGLKSKTGFVDGAATLQHDIGKRPKAHLSAGLGLWGGAQPGVARIDLGPASTLILRSSNAALRISASWRFRVAGRARPGSGPAISVATDF